MTASPALRRWSSVGESAVQVTEIVSAPLTSITLPPTFASLAHDELGASAFVVIRIARLEEEDIPGVVEALERVAGSIHLCLAADGPTLQRMRAGSLASERFSLMLDDVDDRTPLWNLSQGELGAVRFTSDFVARASRQLRVGFVLDAMLTLAQDLGLCTFGPGSASNDEAFFARSTFDYVPSCSALFAIPHDAQPSFENLDAFSRKQLTRSTS